MIIWRIAFTKNEKHPVFGQGRAYIYYGHWVQLYRWVWIKPDAWFQF